MNARQHGIGVSVGFELGVAGGAESIADLVRGELTEERADPFGIVSRYLLSDPAKSDLMEIEAPFEFEKLDKGRALGEVQINVILVDVGDQLGTLVHCQVSFRQRIGIAFPRSTHGSTDVAD